jgi:protein-disulfide isomerase
VFVEYQPIFLLKDEPYSAKALNAWAAVLQHSSPQAALKLHDLLYDNQPYEQNSGQVTDSQIAGWVKDAGGESSTVRSAMATKDSSFFAKVEQIMTDKNLESTPTIFIDGKELPVATVPQLVSEIEDAVGKG